MEPARADSRRRRIVWAFGLVAGVVGGVLSYDVGARIAGVWLALLLALNGAVFCALMAASLVGRLLRPRRR